MKNKKKSKDATSIVKANIVRAFYDAADRVVEENGSGVQGTETASLALRRLNDVIAKADELCSKDFSAALRCAADQYFARISEAQNDSDSSAGSDE